jgi:hypothetical protein
VAGISPNPANNIANGSNWDTTISVSDVDTGLSGPVNQTEYISVQVSDIVSGTSLHFGLASTGDTFTYIDSNLATSTPGTYFDTYVIQDGNPNPLMRDYSGNAIILTQTVHVN